MKDTPTPKETAEVKPTPPKELSDSSLLELVCQLHAKANINYRSKEMHDAYINARIELDFRLKDYAALTAEVEKLKRKTEVELSKLKDERKKFASIIRNMHKPEYAVFIVDGEKIDGYEFADRLNEVPSTP